VILDEESLISIIIPCYNERSTIRALLDAIREQTYPASGFEVILADGMSDDGTREAIAAYAAEYPGLNLRVVDNPDRVIPAALNRAVEASAGEVVIRLDAHSKPFPDYIERCIEALERTDAANVGGVWMIQPGRDAWAARSIAAAAAHPLGAGDARYRIQGEAGSVDTVPFGAFQREWMEWVGPFDESLLTNEDYEYNTRIRLAGGVVWFDPSIRSIYYARPAFPDLARQYARYGYWKAQMLRRYPDTIRWRQAVPPLFVLSALVLGLTSLFSPLARLLFALQLASYALLTVFSGMIQAVRKRDLPLVIGFPIALWTMHFTWGGSFLWGILKKPSGVSRIEF
jgi:succinoglycan biosynthesis protein ExoA